MNEGIDHAEIRAAATDAVRNLRANVTVGGRALLDLLQDRDRAHAAFGEGGREFWFIGYKQRADVGPPGAPSYVGDWVEGNEVIDRSPAEFAIQWHLKGVPTVVFYAQRITLEQYVSLGNELSRCPV